MGNKSFERKCRKKRNTVRAEITNSIMVRIGTHDLFFPQRERESLAHKIRNNNNDDDRYFTLDWH